MNLEKCSVKFHYSFSSGLGACEEGRFIREHKMRMVLTDEWGKEIEDIGQLEFLMIYIHQTWESHFPLLDILDAHSEYLVRYISQVIDTDSEEFDDRILQHYDNLVLGANICLIKNIQVLPKYRGFQIGIKALRDLLFHYASSCALFIVQPYPLQFETSEGVRQNHLLELEKLEKDEEKATLKLMAYYQKLGFEAIEGIGDLLFHNPALHNSNLQKIDLEDREIFMGRNNQKK